MGHVQVAEEEKRKDGSPWAFLGFRFPAIALTRRMSHHRGSSLFKCFPIAETRHPLVWCLYQKLENGCVIFGSDPRNDGALNFVYSWPFNLGCTVEGGS